MDNQILNTGKCEIMLLDLPEGFTPLAIDNFSMPKRISLLGVIHKLDKDPVKHWIDLPEGYTYTILGRLKELTEKDCKELVKECGGAYTNYDRKSRSSSDLSWDFFTPTAKESFASLLRSVGVLLENPYEEPYCEQGCRCTEQQVEDCVVHLKRWKEAQQQVKNPLIIKVEKV